MSWLLVAAAVDGGATADDDDDDEGEGWAADVIVDMISDDTMGILLMPFCLRRLRQIVYPEEG